MFKDFLVCFHSLASYFPHLPLSVRVWTLFFFWLHSPAEVPLWFNHQEAFLPFFFICPNTFEGQLVGKTWCWPLCFTLPPFLMVFHLSHSLWLYFWHLQLIPTLEFLLHTQKWKIWPVFTCPNTLFLLTLILLFTFSKDTQHPTYTR